MLIRPQYGAVAVGIAQLDPVGCVIAAGLGCLQPETMVQFYSRHVLLLVDDFRGRDFRPRRKQAVWVERQIRGC